MIADNLLSITRAQHWDVFVQKNWELALRKLGKQSDRLIDLSSPGRQKQFSWLDLEANADGRFLHPLIPLTLGLDLVPRRMSQPSRKALDFSLRHLKERGDETAQQEPEKDFSTRWVCLLVVMLKPDPASVFCVQSSTGASEALVGIEGKEYANQMLILYLYTWNMGSQSLSDGLRH